MRRLLRRLWRCNQFSIISRESQVEDLEPELLTFKKQTILKINPQNLTIAARSVTNPRVLISNSAFDSIAAYAAKIGGRHEVGGLLLGHRRGDDLEIVDATFPSRLDRSTRTSYVRRDPSHQLIMTKRWVASRFRTDWVGEWHTHPESNPSPSMTDVSTWRRQVKGRSTQMSYLILGFDSLWLGVLSPNQPIPIRYRCEEDNSIGKLYVAER